MQDKAVIIFTRRFVALLSFAVCLSFNLLGQSLVNILKANVGQQFNMQVKGQTTKFTLKEVNNESLVFEITDESGTLRMVRPFASLSKLLTARFPNEKKDYLFLLSFGLEDVEATPWPPQGSKARPEFQSVQSNRDAMINDLSNIAAQAYQFQTPSCLYGWRRGQLCWLHYPR